MKEQKLISKTVCVSVAIPEVMLIKKSIEVAKYSRYNEPQILTDNSSVITVVPCQRTRFVRSRGFCGRRFKPRRNQKMNLSNKLEDKIYRKKYKMM